MLRVDNPATGEIAAVVPLIGVTQLDSAVSRARVAQKEIAGWTLTQRIELCQRWIQAFNSRAENMATDITLQMGKPLAQSRGEIKGTVYRANALIQMAPEALTSESLAEKAGFVRKIAREPIGVVLAIAAWNYPMLIAVNSVVPAVLAGNAVLLKHSERSPLCGDAFAETFAEAGAPEGLVQAIHCTHDVTAKLVQHPGVNYVAFTGSVRGGRAVHAAAAHRFIEVATELGGKDPSYICNDADLAFSVANVVEGATFNAGQSCCAVERIYVHESLYEEAVERALAAVKALKVGCPMEEGSDVGPIAQPDHPAFLATQVSDARAKGARILAGGEPMTVNGCGRYFTPTLIADADHTMECVREESFGPLVVMASVASDEEAIQLMNDSRYGLTASIWTQDVERATRIGEQLETGTVFMNRCDYLDPELPWVGVKDTGRGLSLSRHAFHPLTRLKGYHLRLNN
jgi:acyl-CoA reductase-like NAD-dependent aldehyde dehydrogenase